MGSCLRKLVPIYDLKNNSRNYYEITYLLTRETLELLKTFLSTFLS